MPSNDTWSRGIKCSDLFAILSPIPAHCRRTRRCLGGLGALLPRRRRAGRADREGVAHLGLAGSQAEIEREIRNGHSEGTKRHLLLEEHRVDRYLTDYLLLKGLEHSAGWSLEV